LLLGAPVVAAALEKVRGF